MTVKSCRAPSPMTSGGKCQRTATAVIRPSGRRKVERWVCELHIGWQLRKLQEETGINRMNVTFTNQPANASRPNMAAMV